MSALSLVFRRDREDQIKQVLQTALSWVAKGAGGGAGEVHQYQTATQWRDYLETRLGLAAFGAAVIPGMTGGILIELLYLFHLMGQGAIGTGKLAGATTEAEADLLAIFGLWSGAVSTCALAAAEGSVVVVNSVAYPAFGARVLALGLSRGARAVAADTEGVAGARMADAALPLGKLVEPALAKISAKTSAKVGAKARAGFVPLFGAAVDVGISLSILNELLDTAEQYYEHKVRDGSMR